AGADQSFSSDKRRSRTEEGIEHDIAALSHVKQRVFYHGDRFDGGMVQTTVSSFGANAGGAWIVPNIRAPTTVLTELDIIDVGCIAMLKQWQQLMLRAVETAHSSVRLGPDDEIDRDETALEGGGVRSRVAAPIDE